MSDLRSFTLWARELLTKESGDLLQQVYRVDAETGARLPIPKGHHLETSTEAQAVRQRIEKLLEDEVDAGLKREEAVAKLIKETAFTHLNRFVAFKLMEAAGLVRSPMASRHAANGFKMWVAGHAAEERTLDEATVPTTAMVSAKPLGIGLIGISCSGNVANWPKRSRYSSIARRAKPAFPAARRAEGTDRRSQC